MLDPIGDVAHRAVAASRHGRHWASRPRAIRPARSSTFRCFETAARLMSYGTASSVTEASPNARRARRPRRAGVGEGGQRGAQGVGSHVEIQLDSLRTERLNADRPARCQPPPRRASPRRRDPHDDGSAGGRRIVDLCTRLAWDCCTSGLPLASALCHRRPRRRGPTHPNHWGKNRRATHHCLNHWGLAGLY